MRWIRIREQKDNLAKYCWDISKLAIAALGLVPPSEARNDGYSCSYLRVFHRYTFGSIRLYLGRHGGPAMNPLEIFYIGLGVIALIIGFIIFTDKGLKWKGKD